jgi:hypothetical protein
MNTDARWKAGREASPICEGIVADERQGPKASASHGVKNGEPGAGNNELLSIADLGTECSADFLTCLVHFDVARR